MKRAYQFCLLLYPRDHRDQFADEMLEVFEDACAGSRAHGWAWHVRFSFAEIAGLIGGAAGVWADRRTPVHAEAESSEQRPAQRWMPPELLEAQRRVDANVAAMVHAIANHQFERARMLSNEERVARETLRLLREKYSDEYGMSV